MMTQLNGKDKVKIINSRKIFFPFILFFSDIGTPKKKNKRQEIKKSPTKKSKNNKQSIMVKKGTHTQTHRHRDRHLSFFYHPHTHTDTQAQRQTHTHLSFFYHPHTHTHTFSVMLFF